MNICAHDAGPCWISPEEKLMFKYDQREDGVSEREKSKAELLIELRKIGVDTTKKRYLKPELNQIYDENNISVKQSAPNIKKGWCNSPKEMLHILYQRGYIDSSQVKTPRVMCYYFQYR